MFQKALKISFLTLLVANLAFGIEKDKIASFMQERINEATNVIQQKDLDLQAKGQHIFALLDEAFDYNLMARLSLGSKVWLELSEEQKVEFTQKFISFLKQSYIEKLNLYTDEKLNIIGQKNINDQRIWLETQLIGSKEAFNINYKFYKSDSDAWYIYDVDIIGVSLMQTYRAQFSDILKTDDFDTLLAKLETKTK